MAQIQGKTPVERRRLKRAHLSYYMPVLDPETFHPVGHLVDLSRIGLLLDSTTPITAGKVMELRIDLTPEISLQVDHIQFTARVRWCRQDRIQPSIFNVGFEIMNLPEAEAEIIQRTIELYGVH